MIKVNFDPDRLNEEQKIWWKEWCEKAENATNKAIDSWESGEKISFNEDIWQKLEDWLSKNVFHDKCAYCETRSPRYPGHAEHFRPKGAVANKIENDGKEITEKVNVEVDKQIARAGFIKHPGYFWLAYNWKNLLPSCFDCNTRRGKKEQFPVKKKHYFIIRLKNSDVANLREKPISSKKWNGMYYLLSSDLNDLEDPQILNPYIDNPRDHIRFGYAGIEAALEGSEKGKCSIKVLDLHDDKLRRDRQKAQEDAALKFGVAFAICNGKRSERVEAGKNAIHSIINGEEPYSAAAMDWIENIYSISLP